MAAVVTKEHLIPTFCNTNKDHTVKMLRQVYVNAAHLARQAAEATCK